MDIGDLPKSDSGLERYMDELKVENDCIILKMYGIEYFELEYMLESFKVLCKNNAKYVVLLKKKYREFV